MLLRDAQVLPIWEGTTNVLSLDTLRAIGKGDAFNCLQEKIAGCVSAVRDPALAAYGRQAAAAIENAGHWLENAFVAGPYVLETGARRFALTLGRALELALLVEQAQWSLDHERDGRAKAAAGRFARSGIDLITSIVAADNAALANDQPLPVNE
jgi:hypothetical protein